MQEEVQQLRRISWRNNRKPPFFLREMDQRFPEVIASLTIPWPSPRLHLLGILKTRPPPPLERLGTIPYTPRIHILCGSRTARPPIKRLGRKRRGKQHCRDAKQGGKGLTSDAGVNASSIAEKSLYDELSRAQERCLRKLATVSTTSALGIGAKKIHPGTSSLYVIPGSIQKRWKTVTIAMYNGFDSHNNYDSHDKFNASGQARKVMQTYGLQGGSLFGWLTRLRTTKWVELFNPKELVVVALRAHD